LDAAYNYSDRILIMVTIYKWQHAAGMFYQQTVTAHCVRALAVLGEALTKQLLVYVNCKI